MSFVPRQSVPRVTVPARHVRPDPNFCSDTMTKDRVPYLPAHRQVAFPHYKPGQLTVAGEHVRSDLLFHGEMPMINDDIRRDVVNLTPFSVDRIGLQKGPGGIWSGVMETGGQAFLFALKSTGGFKLRHAADSTMAIQMLDTLIDEERRLSVEARRRESVHTIIKAGSHHIGYKRRDPRTGKEENIAPLGYNPQKPETRDVKPVIVPPAAKKIDLVGHHLLDEDDEHGIEAFRHIARSKAKTRAQVIAAVREYVDENFDGKPKILQQIHDAIMKELFDKGALAEKSAEDDEPTWSKRICKHKPELPKVFDAKGTQLIVGGKPVKLSPEVEQACYSYAKRFLVRGGDVANRAKWDKNFEASIRKLGKLPQGDISYKNFVKRIKAEDAKAEGTKKDRKKPVVETPKTHPHLFITEDGVSTRILAASIPCGGFYTGKKNYGAWVPPLSEKDLEINVSKGGVPAGWKGRVISDPTKEYFMSWRHPVSGEKGYGFLSRMQADLHKFYGAAVLGEQMQRIQDQVFKDITTSKDPAEKAAAICVMLIDRHHFRSGDESYAKEGTFGIASFRRKHVKIDGTQVTFSFVGKKQEPWTRTVDFAGMPAALKFIQQCVKGKGPDDRLWQGSGWKVAAGDINEYLAPFSKGGVTITAKSFRTFHANRYMNEYIGRVEKAAKDFKLTDQDIKKLYKGVKVKDALLNRKKDGKKLADVLELVPYHGAKGKGDTLLGLLPSVASKLGHTTGACRGSYVDPVVVTHFANRHGWDERLPKEKKTREDLPGYDPEDQE